MCTQSSSAVISLGVERHTNSPSVDLQLFLFFSSQSQIGCAYILPLSGMVATLLLKIDRSIRPYVATSEYEDTSHRMSLKIVCKLDVS